MAKRIAGSELTDRNWDQEDEPEDAGIFVKASDEVLNQRQMKKAKRRTVKESSDTAFSGFTGFKGLSSRNGSFIEPNLGGDVKLFTSKPLYENSTLQNKGTEIASETSNESSYYQSLKCLNKSLLEWIETHIKKDPCCILTPIFTDYSKHLKDIQTKNSDNKQTTENTDNKDESSDQEVTFKAHVTQQVHIPQLVPQPVHVPQLMPQQAPFQGNDEDAEYVPPKVETNEVVQEGSVYTKRCKLFYQKDGSWKDRGVGNIHLKTLEDGKTQLIVRADTNLGNILLNIMLSPVLPTKKQGKNNVWMLCIPNPPLDKQGSSEPVPMLLRVKTSEDADELLAKLEELKK